MKKRRIMNCPLISCTVILICCLFGSLDLQAAGRIPDGAAGKCGENLTWEFHRADPRFACDTDGIYLYGSGEMYDYAPGEAPWYPYRSELTEVTLCLEITSIGDHAFYGMEALIEIYLPESITRIGEEAFWGCRSDLTFLIDPEAESFVKSYAITHQYPYRLGVRPDCLEVPEETFDSCGLTYQVKDENAREAALVGAAAKNRKKVRIPPSVKHRGITYRVTAIGASAFQGCRGLLDVTIGKNVEEIGERAFYNCRKLRRIRIKSSRLTSGQLGLAAFKKAGSDGYVRLRVSVPKKKYRSYKKILRSRGISSKAQIH